MLSRNLSHITAQALVPEQILSYVTAVGGSTPLLCGDCVAYERDGHLVLIAYKPGQETETEDQALATMNRAVTAAVARAPASLTVLGPAGPASAPHSAAARSDAYWAIPLPVAAFGQKLRNMLRRGERECVIHQEQWVDEHTALVETYLTSRPLEGGTRHIYRHIPDYLARTPDAALFAARSKADARLLALCIGDFSSLSTAMYMFAFRAKNCPPGVSDALLFALARAGAEQGHQRLNLGLGINDGIIFFKQKWGASLFLPCVQTSWTPDTQTQRNDINGTLASPGHAVQGMRDEPALSPATNAPPDHGVQGARPLAQAAPAGGARGGAPFSSEARGGAPLPSDRLDNASAPAQPDPLLAIGPLTFRENLTRFLSGREREFATIQVEMTSACPGRCGYCPHTTKRKVWRSRHMKDTTFAALGPLLRRTKRVHLQGWGEPLLHPRFLDFAAAARRAGCAVSFTTHGLSMTDELAAKLVKSGIDIVAFSLTGTDEAGNAARAGVPFSGVVSAIQTLNRARDTAGSETPQIHLAYLMLASNQDSVTTLPDLMRDLNVPVAVVSTLDYIPEPGAEKEAFAPTETDKIETARTILQKTAAKAQAMGLSLHYSLPGPSGKNDCNEQIQNCMYIDAEGQLSPCIYVNLPTDEDDPCRRVFGNITDTDPLAVWNKPDFAEFRRRLACGDPDLPCQSCAKRFERVF